MSTGIPAPRDDDPEEVSDKLSIAAAMWARGETADAISWLRRAAASAADAEADDRALELAKAAAELTTEPAAAPPSGRAAMGVTAPTGTKPAPSHRPPGPPPSRPATNAPPKPPPSRSQVPAAMPTAAAAPAPAATPAAPAVVKPIASRPAPRPSASPPPAGQGRLAPLPPLRPLGTASQQASQQTRPAHRSSSSMKAVTGTETAEGSPPSSATMRAAEPAQAPLHEAIEHDQTSVMPVAQSQALAKSTDDGTPVGPGTYQASDEEELRQMMRRDAEERAAATAEAEPITHVTSTEQAAGLSLSIGVRVRVVPAEGGAWVVPDAPGAQGVAAILVPQDASTDLRSVFVKK